MNRVFSELTIEQIKLALGEVVREIVREELNRTPQNLKTEEVVLSRSDVCRLLNLSLSSLNKYVKNGTVPAKRLNGKVLFLQSEIFSCLKSVRTIKGSRQRN